MKTARSLRLVGYCVATVLLLAVTPAANAAMAVVDVRAIAQLTQQIRTLQQQLATARDQLTAARDQLRTYTDELTRQQNVRQQALGSIGSLRDLPPMGL